MAYKGTAILGRPAAQLAQLEAITFRRNRTAPQIAELYLRGGFTLGVRGDLAYAQALLETNFFRFGGVIQPWQNNFAGLGATGPGESGASFATPAEGVMAHLQHLFAYASTASLPVGMARVDPRFDRVERGSAPYVGDLNGRWSVPGTNYGQTIDRIIGEILMEPVPGEPYQITSAFLDVGSQNRPGPCTSSGCWQGVQGIVVHRTASPTMNAWAIRNYFNSAPDGRFASSQFVVDNASILQLMPVGEMAYHTSGKNYTHLGIETCEHNWGTETWPETYGRLVWLTAHLVRSFQLNISDVTGHFWWDPLNRPYDPTHLGWKPSDGQATGLFDWNRFIIDVQAELADSSSPPVPVPGPETINVMVTRAATADCTNGLLINATTYVPIRSYTSCILPEATVRWIDAERRIVVELPPQASPQGVPSPSPAAKSAQLTHPPQPSPRGTAVRLTGQSNPKAGRAGSSRIQLSPTKGMSQKTVPVWAQRRSKGSQD